MGIVSTFLMAGQAWINLVVLVNWIVLKPVWYAANLWPDWVVGFPHTLLGLAEAPSRSNYNLWLAE